MAKDKPIDFEYIRSYIAEHPDDWFPPEEACRRFEEMGRRIARQKPTFSLETGQPFEGPQFSEEELKRRGYEPQKMKAKVT